MPKYKLPPPAKHNKGDSEPTTGIDSFEDHYRRKVTVPADDAILSALNVGETARVTLTGKVERLSSDSDMDREGREKSVSIYVEEVEAYPDGGMDDEQDFKRGFGRGPNLRGFGLGDDY